MTASKRGTWATIRRIAASDRISGLIMLGFALAGLLLANLPFTAHTFEELETSASPFHTPISTWDWALGAGWFADGVLPDRWTGIEAGTYYRLAVESQGGCGADAVRGRWHDGPAGAIPINAVPVLWFRFQSAGHRFRNEFHIWRDVPRLGGSYSYGYRVLAGCACLVRQGVARLHSRVPDDIGYGGRSACHHFDRGVLLFSERWYWFVGIAVCAVVWYFLVRMRKVPWFAVAIVGILAWVMMFEAGVHPTLAGVLVGLLTPAHECYGEKTPRAERYADKLQPFSALLALPIFALFATGVHFESLTLALFVSPVVVAVMVALVVGKPLGIMITAWLSTHVAGLKMAKGLRVRDMFPAACACGIGFTVSFLISSLAYKDAELSAEARFGVLVGSMVAAVISGILLSRQSKKFELTLPPSSKHKHHTADEDAAGEVESVLEDGTVVVSQMINTHPKVK